jgi:hypothetical protein
MKFQNRELWSPELPNVEFRKIEFRDIEFWTIGQQRTALERM